jgi:hypothetical protein
MHRHLYCLFPCDSQCSCRFLLSINQSINQWQSADPNVCIKQRLKCIIPLPKADDDEEAAVGDESTIMDESAMFHTQVLPAADAAESHDATEQHTSVDTVPPSITSASATSAAIDDSVPMLVCTRAK